jgi:cyclopropane-fatty-acyl-phospholipid synthase
MYMAFARIAFERNHVQIHQILGVKPDGGGGAGMPLRPRWQRTS